MTLVSGRISRIGSTSGAQPAGRVWVMTDEAQQTETVVNIDSSAGSARWMVAMSAFEQSRPVEIDILQTTPPNAVADKVRITQ